MRNSQLDRRTGVEIANRHCISVGTRMPIIRNKIRKLHTSFLLVAILCRAVNGFTGLQSHGNVRIYRATTFPVAWNTQQPTALHSSVVAATDGTSASDEEVSSKNPLLTTAIIGTDKKIESMAAETTNSGLANATSLSTIPRIWPCGDALDRRLIILSLPVIANFAIGPLIGAVDLFWVNRMGDALAVAGQAAANQVFNSVFWLTSFLPSVTATLISKENALNNTEGVQDAICQALVVGVFMALVSSMVLLGYPEQVLGSVLPAGAPALRYAKPYLLIRAFAFIPALVSLVGFSAFRGILDTLTPVKISLFANVFNAVLDPILIFTFAMGVPGGMYFGTYPLFHYIHYSASILTLHDFYWFLQPHSPHWPPKLYQPVRFCTCYGNEK